MGLTPKCGLYPRQPWMRREHLMLESYYTFVVSFGLKNWMSIKECPVRKHKALGVEMSPRRLVGIA